MDSLSDEKAWILEPHRTRRLNLIWTRQSRKKSRMQGSMRKGLGGELADGLDLVIAKCN